LIPQSDFFHRHFLAPKLGQSATSRWFHTNFPPLKAGWRCLATPLLRGGGQLKQGSNTGAVPPRGTNRRGVQQGIYGTGRSFLGECGVQMGGAPHCLFSEENTFRSILGSRVQQ